MLQFEVVTHSFHFITFHARFTVKHYILAASQFGDFAVQKFCYILICRFLRVYFAR